MTAQATELTMQTDPASPSRVGDACLHGERIGSAPIVQNQKMPARCAWGLNKFAKVQNI